MKSKNIQTAEHKIRLSSVIYLFEVEFLLSLNTVKAAINSHTHIKTLCASVLTAPS